MEVSNHRLNQFKNIWKRIRDFLIEKSLDSMMKRATICFFDSQYMLDIFFPDTAWHALNFRRFFALYVSTSFPPQKSRWNFSTFHCVFCYFETQSLDVLSIIYYYLITTFINFTVSMILICNYSYLP